MKKIALLVFLLTASMQAQQFNIYDCTTFVYVGYSTIQPTSGCYTTVIPQMLYCYPKFNITTQQWYESGNTLQLEDCYTLRDLASMVYNAESLVNNQFTVLKTDSQLNYYYGDIQPPFQLFCPNTPWPGQPTWSVTYIKMSPTKWRRSFSTDNQP